MRWFWQRRKRKPEAQPQSPQTPATVANAVTLTATASPSVQRAESTSGRLGQPREITSELLLLARDYLHATGGRVRVEDEDVLSATLPDGSLVRYTTTLAKARADESMTLLVEGSEALATMLDDIASRSRITALRLAPAADPVALALQACAVPQPHCGRCLDVARSPIDGRITLCETCPLRENRLVLRWRTPGSLTARVERQEPSVAIELAYLMVARDHQGRRDEWIRHAGDTVSGRTVSILSESTLASATPDELPADYAQLLAAARAGAERALDKPLAATGLFLRQRSLYEYQSRLDDVATTFDRLQRESPEAARAAKSGRKRELAALAEVYAVDIEAQLESACFITSPVATVAIRPRKGRGDMLLRVDLGRQQVIPPDCAQCGASIQAGYVCEAGHVVCAACAAACARCRAWSCATCGEAPSTDVCNHCGQPKQPAGMTPQAEVASSGSLTVAHLEALPPDMWLSAVEWLLASQKISVESRRLAGELAIWQGQTAAGKALVTALRPQAPRALGEFDVRQSASHLAQGQSATQRILLTSAPATPEARKTAQQLGVELLDRSALENLLVQLASAYDAERERQHDETQERADGATIARQAMLDAVDAIERSLTPLRRTRRTGASATTSAGSRALSNARNALERATLAWETLLADWTSAFGERADRAGRLAIHGESDRFSEMADRAAHLQAALLDAVALLTKAPARGESGYTAWRQAILDECAARCEAWRWRIRSYDPAAWNDFTRAWDAKAATKAAEATTAAGHATARADKAQAQALRAG